MKTIKKIVHLLIIAIITIAITFLVVALCIEGSIL